jgi:hypothetical protein
MLWLLVVVATGKLSVMVGRFIPGKEHSLLILCCSKIVPHPSKQASLNRSQFELYRRAAEIRID